MKKLELLEVIKKCPKPPYTVFPLSVKIELICLTAHNWQPCVLNFRDIRNIWLCKISCTISNTTFDNQTSRRLFCKKLPIYQISCRMIKQLDVWYSAKKFAMSSFSDITKVQKAGLAMVRSQTVDDAKSLLSAVSDASTRVNLSSYIVNGFCWKYAN